MFTFASLAVECDRFADVFPIQRQGTSFSLLQHKTPLSLHSADIVVGKVNSPNMSSIVSLAPPVNVWLSQTGALIYKHLP